MESTTRIEPDGTVTSVQTLVIPDVRLPEGEALAALLRELVPAYTRWISLLTAGAVEIRSEPSGVSRARVQPVGPTGLVLGPPRFEGGSFSREIVSGVLVGRAGGTLGVRLVPLEGSVAASVELHGFRPRILDVPAIGPALFRRTQDVIHARHSKGFLAREVAPRLRAAGSLPRGSSRAAAPVASASRTGTPVAPGAGRV